MVAVIVFAAYAKTINFYNTHAMTPTTNKEQRTSDKSTRRGEKKIVEKFPLYVKMVQEGPQDARVRIMNIKEKYRPGIMLAPGKYDVEVTAPGYKKWRRWVNLKHPSYKKKFKINVYLNRK